MNIAELFARIGLKTDEGKAKSFHRAMTTVKIGLIATTAVAAGTAIAIRKITSEAMAGAVAFKQFEIETGASAQELQKWQAVAEQTNQSAESVSSAIKAIVSNQEKIKLGQGDISGYQILGIDPRQDPFKILEELRTKTKGLSDGMRKNILSQIGVGAGLLQTLNLTREQFDEMAGRAWIISPQAIETLTKTKASVDLAARSIRYMKAQIAVGLAPQIRKVTKDFQEFMKVNEKAIIEGFKLGFKYVTMFVKAIYNAGSAINGIVSSTIGWEWAIKGLIGVFIALNAALLLSPIGLIAAGFILLVAVLDDLYTYSQGGKSLFGEMMKEFPELEKTIFGSFKVIRDVFKLLKSFATGEISINDLTKDWGGFGKAIESIYIAVEKLRKLLKIFADGDALSVAKMTKDWGLFGKMLGNVFEQIKRYKEFWKDLGLEGAPVGPTGITKLITSQIAKSDAPTESWIRKLIIGMLKIQGSPEVEQKEISTKTGGFSDFIANLLVGSLFKSEKSADLKDSLIRPVVKPQIIKISPSVTQTNNIDMQINGTSDPVATGEAAARTIQRSINAASAQLARDQ